MINNKLLFNFSVSHSGGGFKRLHAYSKWFNHNGGAWFIIHPNSKALIEEFPNNRFFVVHQSKFERLYNDTNYLQEIKKVIGVPEIYYSYGIPIYSKFGELNWFHLSNVLPLKLKGIPLSLLDKCKLTLLGKRIQSNFKNAEVISAESAYSLELIKNRYHSKLVVSVNGSDDELESLHASRNSQKNKTAVVVGTYRYKAIEDSYSIFEMIRSRDRDLKLIIIGDDKRVPKSLLNMPCVQYTGILERGNVINYLKGAQYYISTTHIENSYNAASEGIFFASESYISDIPPHRELLKNLKYENISVPNLNRNILHLKSDEISTVNLKNWETVIADMLNNHYRK